MLSKIEKHFILNKLYLKQEKPQRNNELPEKRTRRPKERKSTRH